VHESVLNERGLSLREPDARKGQRTDLGLHARNLHASLVEARESAEDYLSAWPTNQQTCVQSSAIGPGTSTNDVRADRNCPLRT
jgi:hypothetical protein